MKLKHLLAAALCVCTLGAAHAAGTGNVLRVGCEATYPPFEFFDSKSGKTVGFDVDIMDAIARRTGRTVKIVSMGFDSIIPALMTGSVDALASAVTITPERAEKVAFAQPYYLSGLAILIRKADQKRITSIDSLKNCAICAQIGTSGAMRAAKVPGAKVKVYNSISEVFIELGNKGCDAVIGDKPIFDYFLQARPNTSKRFYQLPEQLDAEEFGIAVAKNNPALLKEVNDALTAMKADGEYEKIYRKWFGRAP